MKIENFYQQLQAMSKEKNTQRIESFFLTSLETANEERDYSSYLTICNELVLFYQNISAYEQAFQAIEDMLLLLEELQLDDSEHFAAALINAAAVYLNAGDDRQAYEYYRRVLGMLEQGCEVNATQYCIALTGIGECFYRRQEYTQALTAYEKALQEMKTHFGENSGSAILCENCATLCNIMGKESEKQQYLKMASEIKAKMES